MVRFQFLASLWTIAGQPSGLVMYRVIQLRSDQPLQPTPNYPLLEPNRLTWEQNGTIISDITLPVYGSIYSFLGAHTLYADGQSATYPHSAGMCFATPFMINEIDLLFPQATGDTMYLLVLHFMQRIMSLRVILCLILVGSYYIQIQLY